jgi:hypothetical protein
VKSQVLSALAMFFMQCESFLEYQKQLNSRQGRDNTQTLFKVSEIPTDNQIRNILDHYNPRVLADVFQHIYLKLKMLGYLKPFEVLSGQLLITLDATLVFFITMYSLRKMFPSSPQKWKNYLLSSVLFSQ